MKSKSRKAALAGAAILALTASTTGNASNAGAKYIDDGFILEDGQYIWDKEAHFTSIKEAAIDRRKAVDKTPNEKKPKKK
jgi:hypothetical protein